MRLRRQPNQSWLTFRARWKARLFGKKCKRQKKVNRNKLIGVNAYSNTVFPELLFRCYALAKQRPPVLVQIGANDGMSTDPVSCFLRAHEAKAMLIEPQPDAFRKLLENYACVKGELYYENVAVGDSEDDVEMFTIRYGDHDRQITDSGITSVYHSHVLAHAKKHVGKNKLNVNPEDLIVSLKVPSVSINNLLKKNGFREIDVMVIDAEGMDGVIIQSLDMEKYQPQIILFENKHLADQDVKSLDNRLRNYRYDMYSFGRDTVAIRSSAQIDRK